ncbi:hypothetical protein FF38_13302 [Lucilia cuprina]|uniref:Uncharacterized protein n=1 Tax=Lucilia cuprina TaxID=7375 RepID=A0A0L0BNL7_LUCCU|nr:hypothetical protein FF38_13302 [Lucilia cuprina]
MQPYSVSIIYVTATCTSQSKPMSYVLDLIAIVSYRFSDSTLKPWSTKLGIYAFCKVAFFLEKYSMGCSPSSSSFWNRTAPIPTFEASHWTKNGFSKSGLDKMGLDANLRLSSSNELDASGVKWNLGDFLRVSVRGAVRVEKSWMKRRYHPTVPKNLRTSFGFFGGFISNIAVTFPSSGLIFPPPTI